jgi:DNA-binding PadR family transcriptional regulator
VGKRLLQFLSRKKEGDNTAPEPLPLMSPIEALIVRLLIGGGEMYGLQLVDASEGELKRGTVYVTLNRMEDKGFIESRKEPTPGEGPARRMYKVTGHGERVLRAWEGLAQLAQEAGR